MSKNLKIKNSTTEFLIYKSPDWNIKIDVLIKNKNIWLTQKEISSLFWVKIPAISKHLSNIFKEWELDKNSTVLNEWQSDALSDKNQVVIPKAIQVNLTLSDWGKMTLLLIIPEGNYRVNDQT